ncbi:hypothetical protein HPB50_008824 [Hyalomma asiaticum]|uniref:Uncharacterized protein n=1 Tax=Hyalomma asiaticum TaxID=266040 RepID=A0ACB7THB3_HYAAI|nr:hypothetical protein HPB50_008824 [Hyalomma asiaticum]
MSIPKTLLKSTEKVLEVFKAGDKVCFNAQRNHNPKRQEKWEATMVTTVQHGSSSMVFDDYITPITPAVRNRYIPDIAKKPWLHTPRCLASVKSHVLVDSDTFQANKRSAMQPS